MHCHCKTIGLLIGNQILYIWVGKTLVANCYEFPKFVKVFPTTILSCLRYSLYVKYIWKIVVEFNLMI